MAARTRSLALHICHCHNSQSFKLYFTNCGQTTLAQCWALIRTHCCAFSGRLNLNHLNHSFHWKTLTSQRHRPVECAECAQRARRAQSQSEPAKHQQRPTRSPMTHTSHYHSQSQLLTVQRFQKSSSRFFVPQKCRFCCRACVRHCRHQRHTCTVSLESFVVEHFPAQRTHIRDRRNPSIPVRTRRRRLDRSDRPFFVDTASISNRHIHFFLCCSSRTRACRFSPHRRNRRRMRAPL